jgi:Protein of unknown function (DUF2911)
MYIKRISLVIALIVTFSLALPAQEHDTGKSKKPPLSPPAHTETTINGKKVSIDYSAPSMRGRKIMGGLVPFGQVWRTGANAATTLKTETDLLIGGQKVPAGTYTIYSLPGEKDWQLIINKQTTQWGTEYHQEQDLVRIPLKKEATAAPVETFKITLSPTSLVMEWENTKLSTDLKAAK